jgi:ATP-binding cassette subfamily B protein
LYQGTQAVMAGRISAGHLGQTVVYVIILASAFAVLGEVYGDLLRAAGATERLMELLASQSSITSPPNPVPANTPQAGSAIEFESLSFHYPSRPAAQAKARCFSCCYATLTHRAGALCSTAYPRKICLCKTCANTLASCRKTP